MAKIVDKQTRVVHESRHGRFEIVTVELPNGKRVEYEQWVRPDGVLIMAIDDHGNIAMTREWRFAAGKIQWDLPRGYIEEGETPEDAASRELKEETGFSARRFIPIHQEGSTSGYMKATSYFFVAEELEHGKKEGGDEDHEIEVVVMPLEQAFHLAIEEVAIEPPLVIKALLVLRKWLREQGRI